MSEKSGLLELDFSDDISENETNSGIKEYEEQMTSLMSSEDFKVENNTEEMRDILLAMGVPEHRINLSFKRMKMTGEHLSVIMKDFNFLSAEKVAEALSIQSKFHYFKPSDIDNLLIPEDLIELFKEKMLRYDGIVPIKIDPSNNEVTCLISNINKYNAVSKLCHPLKYKVAVASEGTMQTIYRKFYMLAEEYIDTLIDRFIDINSSKTLSVDTDAPSLIKDLMGNILRHACNSRVSDIYFHKTNGIGLIKYSVDGTAYIFKMLPFDLYDRLMNKMILDSRTKPEDLNNALKDAAIEWENEADREEFIDVFGRYGFRLELGGSKTGITAVIRILDRDSNVADLDNLNFDEDTYNHLQHFITLNAGLILVTGPTGSGKTTSLYAMLKQIDPVERSVQAIEMPVEYQNPMWQQYEIARNIKTSEEGAAWGKHLKGLLRNAPKAILMGEVRDNDTAKTLIDAANTGHLVFTTLHTNTAASAIARLKKLDVDMETLGGLLLGVLAQRLVRVLCHKCSVEDTRESTADMLKDLPDHYKGQVKPRMACKGGCSYCSYQGYRGRRMVYELLVNSPETRKLIERGEVGSVLAKQAIAPGRRMWDTGLVALASGATSAEEILKNIQKEELDS